MSMAPVVVAVIKSSPHLAQLSLTLLWVYLTLGRRVSKTRRAFERHQNQLN